MQGGTTTRILWDYTPLRSRIIRRAEQRAPRQIHASCTGENPPRISYRHETSPVRFEPERLTLTETHDYQALIRRPQILETHPSWWLHTTRRVLFTVAFDITILPYFRAVAWFVAVQTAEPAGRFSMPGEDVSAVDSARLSLLRAYQQPGQHIGADVFFDEPTTKDQRVREAYANAGAVILRYPQVAGEELWRLINRDALDSANVGRTARRRQQKLVPLSLYRNREGADESLSESEAELVQGTVILSAEGHRALRNPEELSLGDTLTDYEALLDAEYTDLLPHLSETDCRILAWHRGVLREMVAQRHGEIPSQKDCIRRVMGWKLVGTPNTQKNRLLNKLERLDSRFHMTQLLLERLT